VQAVILARQSDTAAQVARALDFSRRAVQAWVAAYSRGDLDALPDRPHPGRAPTLPHDREGAFLERIDLPPRPEEDRFSRTLRDGQGYNEESAYVQTHPYFANGVLACRCPRYFPTRPTSHSRMS
jgi:hypothetical protein